MFSLILLLVVSTVASSRLVVPIDLGWRVAPLGGHCTFPVNTTCQIGGLNQVSAVNSAAACAAAACSANSVTWQFGIKGQGCWIGDGTACAYQNTDWVGGTSSSGPFPDAPEAQLNFDDSSWRIVDTPHDATVEGNYSANANGGEGFLPAAITWYRKHFFAPSEWSGQAVTLTVDASLSTSTFWLNGKQLVAARPSGYLPLSLRLDGAAGLNFGAANVFVAYVDGSETTGWWYEGSGLMRKSRLVVTTAEAYIQPNGVAAPAYVDGDISPNSPNDQTQGLFASSAIVTPSVDVFYSSASTKATAAWRLIAADGVTVVGTSTSAPASGAATLPGKSITVQNAQLWSVQRPYLFTLETTVTTPSGSSDALNISIGLRSIAFDAERGMFVNEQHVKMRGFCNHESFTGVGSALPDRVDLLRVQQMRGVGGNAWRTSHNPPEEVLLDLADRLGILVLDENRVLATQENCIGPHCRNVPTYTGDPAADVGALARRDRTHASIFAYSLCNEAGCGDGGLLVNDTVIAAKQAAYDADGSRVVGANMGWLSPTTPKTPMSDALDLMGFSHAATGTISQFHQMEPAKPLVMSECCSCETQRGEDDDQPRHNSSVYYSNFNAPCLAQQVGTSDSPEYMSGTFVWTLSDYMGEPGRFPHVSSSFGAIDLSGFMKAGASWFRAWWLSNITASDAGRPPLPAAASAFTVHLVEQWAPPKNGSNNTRTLHVYTNAPLTRIVVNGVASAVQPVPFFEYATFSGVVFAPGNITAEAIAADGTTVLASHTRKSWGQPSSIILSLDAPSVATGTGSAVYLDGGDVALVRATVVDAVGNICADATPNITFGVSQGPGRVWGVGNGDPACQEPSHAPWRTAYHGLARAIVRVTLAATGSDADRALLAAVNTDAGASAESSSILIGGATPPAAIIVTASANGLQAGSVSIKLSVDAADEVRNVATRSVAAADLSAA